jgi:hypothetical protein
VIILFTEASKRGATQLTSDGIPSTPMERLQSWTYEHTLDNTWTDMPTAFNDIACHSFTLPVPFIDALINATPALTNAQPAVTTSVTSTLASSPTTQTTTTAGEPMPGGWLLWSRRPNEPLSTVSSSTAVDGVTDPEVIPHTMSVDNAVATPHTCC